MSSINKLMLRKHCACNRLPVITYLHICENDKFGMGVFCIPGGTNIALHDHPQMTVFSR